MNIKLRNPAGVWRAVLALVAALLLPMSPGMAQSTDAGASARAPVTLSEEQVNHIVEAVTGAVLRELEANPGSGLQPAPPVARTSTPGQQLGMEEGLASVLHEKSYLFGQDFETALLAFPALLREVGSILSRLDGRPEGRGPVSFLAVIAMVFAGALALSYGTTAFFARVLPGGAPAGGAASIGETLRRAAANLAGIAVFWVVSSVAANQLFSGQDMQAIVGHWLLMALAQLGLFYTVFLIWFRPREPAYRIVPLEARDARLAMRLFMTVLAIAVVRSWITLVMKDNQPQPVIAAGLLFNNFLFVSSFFLAAIPARDAVRRWIENAAIGVRLSAWRRWLAASWLNITGTSVLAISLIHAYGAVTGFSGVMTGLTGTVRTVLAVILVCALTEFIGRRSDRADQVARRAIPKLPGLVSQMLRVFLLLAAGVYFIKLWCVDALGIMTAAQWSKFAGYAFEPLAASFLGYLAISYVNYISARYLATHPATVTKVREDGEAITMPDRSSRLRTLIPILRITSIIIIIIMISLLVLSHMGFNITPLLAGASVIGLAISFGSQALVKDIVSGVLFLAEDSFRVGEFIECGNSKGTVDGFTLRSIRLRHPDGQIYTVPFGQIGEIINFSRDWATVKFNMSLDRDVDLDDVRSVTKAVAADIKADFKDRVLEPLKVQGVKDVTDTAMVVQFMFTSLPIDPGEIERAARSRLLRAFKKDGIALSRHPWFGATAGQSA